MRSSSRHIEPLLTASVTYYAVSLGATSASSSGSDRVIQYPRSLGATSASSSGASLARQYSKNLGSTSPAQSGTSKAVTNSRALGALSAGSIGIDRTYQVARSLGVTSPAKSGTSWAFVLVRGFGIFSAASAGISQIIAQGRNFGVTSPGSSGIAKIWSAAKNLGSSSPGSPGITKNATFSKSFGVSSVGSNGIAKVLSIPKNLGVTSPSNGRYDRNTLYVKDYNTARSVGSNGQSKIAILTHLFSSVVDDFNRADGVLGAGWVAPSLSIGAVAPAIIANRVQAPSANSGAVWNDSLGPDVEVRVEFPVTPTSFFNLYARAVSPSDTTPDGYRLSVNIPTNLWRIQRQDGGSTTVISTAVVTQPIAAGDAIMLQAIGSTLQAWYKPAGGQWTQKIVAFDSTYLSAGYSGFLFNDTTAAIDNFAVGDVLTAVNQAYVTWIEFEIPVAAASTFLKSFGATSAGENGVVGIFSGVKSFGAKSPAALGVSKGFQIAKSFGSSSAANSGIVKGVGIPKTFGVSSAGSLAITKALNLPFKSFGATSALSVGMTRKNVARVTWVEFQVPPALSTTFAKSFGAASTARTGVTEGLGLATKFFGATSAAKLGISTPTASKVFGASSTLSNGLSAPRKGLAGYYQTPFSYTVTPLATKVYGAISPGSSGSDKALTYVKPVGATSAGEDGLSKTVIFSKSFGVVSASSSGLSQLKVQGRSFGAVSAASGALLRAHSYSKALGAISAGSSGVSKLWTAPKTLGAISAGNFVLAGVKSSAFSKVFGAVAQGSSGISKTASFLNKSVGAVSASRAGFVPHAVLGAISVGQSGQSRITLYNKSLGATSGSSAGVSPHVAVTVFGATSPISLGISRIIVHNKSFGAISTSTFGSTFSKYVTTAEFGAISEGSTFLTYTVPLRTFDVEFGSRATGTAGLVESVINARFLGTTSRASSGITYNITGLLKRQINVFSAGQSGIQISVIYYFLPGRIFDNTLLSAGEDANLLSTEEDGANLLATRIEV